MEINFIQQICNFDKLSAENLNANAIAIYYHLFNVNNRCGWKEWFTETDLWIERSVGISRRETVLKALNLLKQKGFIDFKRGERKGQPSRYKILPLINSGYDSGKDSAYNSGYDSGKDSVKDSVRNSDIPKHKTKTKNNIQSGDFFKESNESAEIKSLLFDFEEMRKKNKKPMTNKAKELFLSKLEKMSNGNEQIKRALLEQSIEHGWLTLYELKELPKPTPSHMTEEQKAELAKKREAEAAFYAEQAKADFEREYGGMTNESA